MSKLGKWLHGLGSAVITGASTALLSSLGVTAVTDFGIMKTPSLTWRQMFVIMGVSGLVGACAYLKQSPLPQLDSNTANSGDTTTINK